MTAKSSVAAVTVIAALLSWVPSTVLSAQTAGQSIGSVRIPRAVRANGQALAAGTYTLRLSAESVTPVVGQPPEAARWVEFVQDNQVRGRELAVVVTAAAARQPGGPTLPGGAGPSVQTLRGGDYLRVWVQQAGTHYLIYLSAAS